MNWLKSMFGIAPNQNEVIADFFIAGLQHYRGNDLAELIKIGDTLELRPQPSNPHDPNAIIILWNENKLGYVPMQLSANINRQISQGIHIKATIVNINPIRFGRKWLEIQLSRQS